MKKDRPSLGHAQGFGEVWEIVEDTIKTSLDERRVGMMLFLADLPLRLGAYHPVGMLAKMRQGDRERF